MKKKATMEQIRRLFFGKHKAWLEDQIFIPNSLMKYTALGKPNPVTVKEWDDFFSWHFMGRKP